MSSTSLIQTPERNSGPAKREDITAWMEVGTTSSVRGSERKYKGVRRRRWGKWVSEIRVPGTRERLWLGSYSSPEAAAVAHDTAVFFLRGPGPPDGFNFQVVGRFLWARLSPRSVQRAASDTGMAVDAELIIRRTEEKETEGRILENDDVACGWDWGGGVQDISFDDLEF